MFQYEFAILSNPLYIGKVKYKDEFYDGEHEGIVSDTIFQQVQEQLEENRRNLIRGNNM